MNPRILPLLLAGTLGLGACAVMPSGPSVMALPGTGKTFDQFRGDDYNCRQFALGQVGGVSAQQASNTAAVGSAAIGTALGAAAGAAFDGGSGAAVGAGVGLLTGAAVGAGNSYNAGYGSQRQYDAAYVQCMYASGNRVPVYGQMVSSPRASSYAAPPPNYQPYYPPPPPPGYVR
ncbi:YMGG-like glycine zipper-containing protein [Cupriavidus campinensis]|uniref:YMGG-like glycine zipper-containing protein n=1 Tax=Cupriavidus campinensis TaxID=151783 RepID=UPI0011ED0104|nr:YMGG-like glycine zipper-containing protein [Cupriavidus campinensis]